MQPYHTLKGSGSLLLSLFKVCGCEFPEPKEYEFPKPKEYEFPELKEYEFPKPKKYEV